MTNTSDARPTADPEAVAELITELVALEQRDPKAFAQRFATNLMEPLVEETTAFRSDELVSQALAAARRLTEQTMEIEKQHGRSAQKRRGSQEFLRRVAYERRILESILNGLRAKRGQLPHAPNPRQRAYRRLANENLKGDVAKGRFRDLIEEEKAVDAARREDQKRERKEARLRAREAVNS